MDQYLHCNPETIFVFLSVRSSKHKYGICPILNVILKGATHQVSMHSPDKSFESGIVLSFKELIRYSEVGEPIQLVFRRAILVDSLWSCIPEDCVVSCGIIATECIFTCYV